MSSGSHRSFIVYRRDGECARLLLQHHAGDGTLSDVTGLIGQYVHGNEPSHHIAYLYTYLDPTRGYTEIGAPHLQRLLSEQARRSDR